MTNEQHIENLKKLKSFHNGSYGADIDRAIKVLGQEPKTGHWIISPNDCFVHCSECGLHGDKGIYKHYGWCPNCGCRMFEPQEGSEKRGAGMINTKETIEETLTEYGVPFTDALADRLIKEIYYECDQYLSEFKDKFIRILKTTDSGDYLDDMDYVSIDDVKKAFQLADIELSKESKTFKGEPQERSDKK